MTSILIVRTSAIGDVIQTLPVLEYLRKAFPQAQIDWVVERGIAPLLEQLDKGLVNRVIPLDTKQWARQPGSLQTIRGVRDFCRTLRQQKYDYLFDLQGNIKSGCVTFAAKAKQKIGYGRLSVREKPNLLTTSIKYDVPKGLNIRHHYLALLQSHFNEGSLSVSPHISFRLMNSEKERLEEIVAKCSSGLKLMIAMGSKWENKRLKEETLEALLCKIAGYCPSSFLFIYGSVQEKLIADRLSVAFSGCAQSVGELSLPLWQTLMDRMDGVIAVDSAALHLAGTTQTPTFSVFGPTSAQIFKPPEERHHAFQGTCPYGRTFVKQCPILRSCPTGACIRDVSAESIFESFVVWYTHNFSVIN